MQRCWSRGENYTPWNRKGPVQLTNRHGTPVDPVPFLVVAALSFLVSYSYGPIYCLALGLSLPVGIGISTAVFCVVVALSYDRFVLRIYPELRGEVPAAIRLRGLFYTTLVLSALLVLLGLPFVLE